MTTKIERWGLDHPFALSFFAMLIVVIPGFIVTTENIERTNAIARETNRAVAQNQVVITCVTEWVAAETDALQDRDAVSKTELAAELDLWTALFVFIQSQPANARDLTLEEIQDYKTVLRRLRRAEEINPYPEIEKCLGDGMSSIFALAAYAQPSKCFGRRVTIRGDGDDDILQGTDGRDVIRSYRGSDLVVAGGGNDFICAGKGTDTINGGDGKDRAKGGRGDDICVQVEAPTSC